VRLFLILALMAAPRIAMARPDMAAVAEKAHIVSVFWIDSLPSPDCDPAFTDSLRFTGCHAVRAVSVSPGQDWNRRLAKLLKSDMKSWINGHCGFSARAVVRFLGESAPSKLVVFADRCDSTRAGLLMIRVGEPLEYRAMAPRPDNVLALLQEMYPLARTDSTHERTAIVDEPEQSYDEPPKQPKPEYPRLARKRGIEGKVVLQALVGLDGSAKEVKVTRGIGELDQAAIEAVKKWKFRPAYSRGQPIECWVLVPVWFHF
jgi:TonB family protein